MAIDIRKDFKEALRKVAWQPGHRVLVAVSGGLDSMSLAALCLDQGLDFGVAHCNFQLRGLASDKDELLVKNWCKKHGVPCFSTRFNTHEIMRSSGESVQVAARRLRYEWFDSICKSEGYDLLFTAHHQQDNIETLLMNFFKGTGIQGMQGIPESSGYIRRPLLGFEKAGLKEYAEMHQIPWREDASNAGDDYLRNKIRHQLWPVLESIFPDPRHLLSGNISRMKESAFLYDEAIQRHKKRLLEKRGQDWVIPVLKMKASRPLNTIFYELLKPFGFQSKQLPDIVQLLDSDTGKQVLSDEYRVIRNRNLLIITALKPAVSDWISLEKPLKKYRVDYGRPGEYLELELMKMGSKQPDEILKKYAAPNTLCLDSSNLSFPLLLRPWKEGDYFYPLGMGRKKKKVSRFLIDMKIALHEKDNIWVLVSNRHIIGIPGFRIDERFKMSENTGEFLKVKHFSPEPAF